MTERQRLGVITAGSLVEGLQAKLDPAASVEEIRVGQFVVIQGQRHEFFCLITDVALGATNPRVLQDPPEGDEFAAQVLAGTSTFGQLAIQPMLMLPRDLGEGDLQPVRTVPSHFSPVYPAQEWDFTRVFGQDTISGQVQIGKKKFFEMGKPLDMEVPVCLNLERFVERSNGIFGKSGTGKSFLARLLLCGIVRANAAVNLVFDMHSEYGHDAITEAGGFVKGLRQLFPGQVLVYSLDPESSRRRGVPVDAALTLGLNQIEAEDVVLLQEELNLTSTAVESSFLLVSEYKDRWLEALLEMDAEGLRDFAEARGGHTGALSALQRKLRRVEGLGFTVPSASESAIGELIECLEHGKHVVLEFGRYRDVLSYMLVANVITRRIHRLWVDKTERYLQSKDPADRPPQLVITIEEAHKFLNPQAARQTIFGTIAREMRKYYATLMVIDQRPSGIDSEVLSQIGTRVTALLNDEKDIEAVFTGVSGAAHLRAVLAGLDPRQQALVMGHAVPMPVVIRTRSFDEAFYAAIGQMDRETRRQQVVRDIDDLFG